MGSCNGVRTLIDILKSCYWVIVVSIWASIHPNVPDVEHVHPETDIGNLLNQAVIMVVAFLAPELIMLWAMRQRFMAKQVADKFQKYRWTKAHGFLCIMKGIALYDQTNFICYLQYPKHRHGQKEQEIIQKIEANFRLEDGDSTDSREPPQFTQDADGHIPDSGTAQAFPAPRPSVGRIETGPSPTATITSPTERPSPSTSGLRQREPTLNQSLDDISGVATDVVSPTRSSGARENRDLSSRNSSPLSPHVIVDFDPEPSSCQSSSDSGTNQESPLPGLLEYLLEKGLVNISETDIADTLNHGDTFSKLILISQTAWFVSKMIGRISTMLYVTELEIVALTSVLLSFVAQVCWWGKPQRVRHPYKIMLPSPSKRILASCAGPSSDIYHKSLWGRLYSEISQFGKRVCADFHGTRKIYPRVPLPAFVVGYPLYLLAAEITALLEADSFDDGSIDGEEGNFDFLFSCGIDVGSTPTWIYGALSSISVIVGMFHFGAWRSTIFPPKEHLWWRLCTVLVTVLPVVLATTYFYLGSREQCEEKKSRSQWMRVLHGFMRGSFNLSAWLYLAARLALVSFALAELRRLPHNSNAFCDVEIGLGFHIG